MKLMYYVEKWSGDFKHLIFIFTKTQFLNQISMRIPLIP